MSRALALARKGTRAVRPNPRIGSLLVRGGRIVAEGYHSRFGGPHAEVKVLARAGERARGGTLYVTLEPCSTKGKTPPCVNSVIASGVKRVVIGTTDPNPRNHARSARILRRAGIAVELGVLEAECRELIRDFAVWAARKRPYTLLKLAESLDGKIATASGDSKWISSPPSRREAHRLRAAADAIVIGIGTALADDPRLDVRHGFSHPGLLKVIVDSRGRLSPSARLLRTPGKVLVAVSAAPAARVRRLEKAAARVAVFPGKGGRVDLERLWGFLAAEGVTRVLVEGGGELAGALFAAGLLDEIHLFVAPILIGGADSVPALGGKGTARVELAPRLENLRVRRRGPDLWVSGFIKPG